MATTISTATPLPGNTSLPIPFPETGPWLDEGQTLDIGRFSSGLCSGNFYKTIDNKLYIFLEVMTWEDVCVEAYMPLRLPDEGISILHIRWADTGVRLQQDAYPPIHEVWRQPR